MGMNYYVYAGPCILVKEKPEGFKSYIFAAETCNERLAVDDSLDGSEFLISNQGNIMKRSTTWEENAEQPPVFMPDIQNELRIFTEAHKEDIDLLISEGVNFEITWAIYDYYC